MRIRKNSGFAEAITWSSVMRVDAEAGGQPRLDLAGALVERDARAGVVVLLAGDADRPKPPERRCLLRPIGTSLRAADSRIEQVVDADFPMRLPARGRGTQRPRSTRGGACPSGTRGPQLTTGLEPLVVARVNLRSGGGDERVDRAGADARDDVERHRPGPEDLGEGAERPDLIRGAEHLPRWHEARVAHSAKMVTPPTRRGIRCDRTPHLDSAAARCRAYPVPGSGADRPLSAAPSARPSRPGRRGRGSSPARSRTSRRRRTAR